jgi:sugar phosphate isomerase/epimerase
MLKIGIESSAYLSLDNYKEGLKKLKEHGYDCIDYQEVASAESECFSWDENRRRTYFSDLKSYADMLGISFSQMHGLWPTNDKTVESRNAQFDFYIKQLEIASMLGCPYLVIHPLMPYGWAQEEDSNYSWKINKDFFLKLLPYAERANVVICLENIPVNMQLGHISFVNKMVNEVNSTFFKACLDTGHANVMKDDLYQGIKELGDNLHCLHIHDNKGRSDEHTCPYFGNIDWDLVVLALKEIGYDGCISLETYISEKMFSEVKEEMQISLAKVAKSLAEKISGY